MIRILKSCERELKDFPEDVKGDIADALARLEVGQHLSMPLSRPMPSIGHRVHELRLRDMAGIYRVVYFIESMGQIILLRAFKKTSQFTPSHNIALAKKRLKELV